MAIGCEPKGSSMNRRGRMVVLTDVSFYNTTIVLEGLLTPPPPPELLRQCYNGREQVGTYHFKIPSFVM